MKSQIIPNLFRVLILKKANKKKADISLVLTAYKNYVKRSYDRHCQLYRSKPDKC